MSFARCALSYRGNCREVEASRGLAHRAKRNAHRSCAPILHGSPASHYKDVPPMQITDMQNQPGGVEGLGGLLGQLGGGGLMDNVVEPQPTDVAPGNQLLGHIFGSKDVSRNVAQNAAAQTGLEPSVLKLSLIHI